MSEPRIALQMTGVSKRFPGTLAVDAVDFTVYAGEVHALLGENGAGKSTLMKILAGSFADYTGEIAIDGKPVTLHSPAQANTHGIAMIHQEMSLARPLSVAENLRRPPALPRRLAGLAADGRGSPRPAGVGPANARSAHPRGRPQRARGATGRHRQSRWVAPASSGHGRADLALGRE